MQLKHPDPEKRFHNFNYVAASIDVIAENIQGSWLNENGVILSTNNKLLFNIASAKRSFWQATILGNLFHAS